MPEEFIHYAKLLDKVLYKTYEQLKCPGYPKNRLTYAPPPSDLALGRFVRRVLVNGHLVEFVHLVGSVERGFELRARGIGAH